MAIEQNINNAEARANAANARANAAEAKANALESDANAAGGMLVVLGILIALLVVYFAYDRLGNNDNTNTTANNAPARSTTGNVNYPSSIETSAGTVGDNTTDHDNYTDNDDGKDQNTNTGAQ